MIIDRGMFVSKKKVAVLGGGNGGITAAADLTSRGFEVRLYELPRFSRNLEPIMRKGGILFKSQEGEKFVKTSLVTTDIAKAIAGTDIVMLVIPSIAVEEFAKECAPHLEEGQKVFINGAAAMGSVRFMQTIRTLGIETDFRIGESASLTYACRVAGEAEAELHLRVKEMFFAAYPSKDTPDVLQDCKELYDSLIPATNVWETCLNNGNPESHPGPSLLNAGRIEFSKGDFYLYSEGITETVSNVIKAIASERRALCEALGLTYWSTEERLVRLGYCEPGGKLHEVYNKSKVFGPIKGPLSLTSRYFTEDIPMGLVLWSSLGKTLKVATPVIDGIIALGGALLGRDYVKEGITLDKLRFTGENAQDINDQVMGKL